MATIPNLDTAGIQENPLETDATPSTSATPIQDEAKKEPAPAPNPTLKQEESMEQNSIDSMKSVQELADEQIKTPPPPPPPKEDPEAAPMAAAPPATTQPEDGALPTSSTSKAASEGSGTILDKENVPSYEANMTPKELATYKATTAMIETGEGNLLEFMAGNSPLTGMIMNKSLQTMRAGNSAQLNAMKQTLAEQNMTGKSEGNSLLMMIARNQNVAMGDMMASLTIDARQRLEDWNKYGLKYGNEKFNNKKQEALSNLDRLIKQGASPEELNKHASGLTEAYGINLPDFTDPNNTTNYNKAKVLYADKQAVLADKLATGDWEGYNKVFDEMVASGEFKGYAFADLDKPNLEDFMTDYKSERRKITMENMSDNMKFMEANGDVNGAAATYANSYGLGGVFSDGTPLTIERRAELEQGYINQSAMQKEDNAVLADIWGGIKGTLGRDELLKFAKQQAAANPTSSFGKQMQYYVDNPELLDMPAGYMDSREKDRTAFAAQFSFKHGDPTASDFAGYEEMLVDSYGESGLTDKATKLLESITDEELTALGLDRADIVDADEKMAFYAKYDLDNKITSMSPDAKIIEMERIIMAGNGGKDSEFFDSPEEMKELKSFVGALTSGSYEIGTNGMLELKGDAVFPWSAGSGSEYLYQDLFGDDFSGDYTYTVAKDDTYMQIGYDTYEENKSVLSYSEFQEIFKQTDKTHGTGSDPTNFTRVLNENIAKSQVSVDYPTEVITPSIAASIFSTNPATAPHELYQRKDILDTVPNKTMRDLLLSDNNVGREFESMMIESGSLIDASDLVSFDDGDSRLEVKGDKTDSIEYDYNVSILQNYLEKREYIYFDNVMYSVFVNADSYTLEAANGSDDKIYTYPKAD